MTDPNDATDTAAIDEHMRRCVPGSDVERAWRRIRQKYQAAKRISSQSLPAVSSSAQHFIAARGHLDAGIDALAGVTAGREEPEIKDPT